MVVISQNASGKTRETLPPTLGDFGTLHYPKCSIFASLVLASFTRHIYTKRFSQNPPVYLLYSLSPALFSPLANLLYLLSPSVLRWIRPQTSFIASSPRLCLLISSLASSSSPPLSPPSLPASAPLSLPVSSVTIPPPLQDPFYLHITPPQHPTPTQPARRRSSVKY